MLLNYLISLLLISKQGLCKSITGNLTYEDVIEVYSGQLKVCLLAPLVTIIEDYQDIIGNASTGLVECDMLPNGTAERMNKFTQNSTAILDDLPSLYQEFANNIVEDKDYFIPSSNDSSLTITQLGYWLYYNHWSFSIFYNHATQTLPKANYPADYLFEYDNICVDPDYLSSEIGSSTEKKSSIETSTSTIANAATTTDSSVHYTSTYTVTTREFKGLNLLLKREVTDDDFESWLLKCITEITNPIADIINNYIDLVDKISGKLASGKNLPTNFDSYMENVVSYTANILDNVLDLALEDLAEALIYENDIYVEDQTMIIYDFNEVKENSVDQIKDYLSKFVDNGSFKAAELALEDTTLSSSSSISTIYSSLSSTSSNASPASTSSSSSHRLSSIYANSTSSSTRLSGTTSAFETLTSQTSIAETSSSQVTPISATNGSGTYTTKTYPANNRNTRNIAGSTTTTETFTECPCMTAASQILETSVPLTCLNDNNMYNEFASQIVISVTNSIKVAETTSKSLGATVTELSVSTSSGSILGSGVMSMTNNVSIYEGIGATVSHIRSSILLLFYIFLI